MEVTVEFDAAGNSTVSVKGAAGSSCKKATADIEAALGKVQSVRKTADYSKAEETKNQRTQKG